MIYAVNKRTKEHRVKGEHELYSMAVWRELRADPDGWIEWQSSEYEGPMPYGALCEIKLSSGDGFIIGDPEDWDWSKGGDQWIIAYRPILDADANPEAPAWNGEGLPPVGCECEVLHDDEWVGCEVIAHYRPCNDGPMVAVYAYAIEDGRKVAQKIKSQFRPIRSEEDRAVEEMMYVSERSAPAEKLCRSLYRAGYRK